MEENQQGQSHTVVLNMEGQKPQAEEVSCKDVCHPPTKECFLGNVPIIDTFRTYNVKEYLLGDVVAGITVGVMLIPQGMAYALLATLPPEIGLYSSVVPIIIYAVFGTSRQLAVGPVAIISLLVAEAIESQGLHFELLNPEIYPESEVQRALEFATELKIEFAFLLAFFVGLLSFLAGVLRAGLFSSFLSHSVLVGFTAGAAVVIGLSQLKHLLGFEIEKTSYPFMTLIYALRDIADTNPATITLGLIGIVYMLFFRFAKQKWTKPLVFNPESGPSKTSVQVQNVFRKFLFFWASLSALEVVIFGTLFTQYYNTDVCPTRDSSDIADCLIKVVGDVPGGFPTPSAPDFGLLGSKELTLNTTLGETEVLAFPVSFGSLFVSALVIVILGFMESFAVADRYARKLNYSVDANKELRGLGLANMVGSFFSAYPVTGGFSRTAVNEGSGAKTTIASLISAIIVLFVIFVLTDSFFYMPKTILAAIVLVAVSSLFDFHAMKLTWQVARWDFWVIIITFLMTIFLGTEIGLAIGFGSSVLILLKQVAFPHTAVLGTVESGTNQEVFYRNVLRFPDAERPANVLIFRIDASFNFANKVSVMDKLFREIDETNFEQEGANYRPVVILSCEGINSMDVSGLEALIELQGILHSRNISLIAAAVKGPVRDAIEKQNAYLARHNLPLVLPWAHSVKDISFPTSLMVASIDEGLDYVVLNKSTDKSTVDGASSASQETNDKQESVMSVI